MAKAIVPAASHSGSVGKSGKVFGCGYFDVLSDGDAEIAVSGIGKKTLYEPSATLHVRDGGLDSNATPGTAADPFATPQGALNALAARAPGYKSALTLNLGPGSFVVPNNPPSGVAAREFAVAGSGMGVTFVTAFATSPLADVSAVGGLTITGQGTNGAGVLGLLSRRNVLANVEFNFIAGKRYATWFDFYGNDVHLAAGTIKLSGTPEKNAVFLAPGHSVRAMSASAFDLSGLEQTDFSFVNASGGSAWFRSAAFTPPPAAKVHVSAASGSRVIFEQPAFLAKILANGGAVVKDAASFITGVA